MRDFVEPRPSASAAPRSRSSPSRIEPYARSNSLGQKLVQLMMPGVPDLY